MKTFFLIAAITLIAGILTKGTIAGDIYGYVDDTNKKALPAVDVSTKDEEKIYNEQTSGSGHYSLSLEEGTYTITYEKEGYKTQTHDISIKKSENKYLNLIIMDAN